MATTPLHHAMQGGMFGDENKVHVEGEFVVNLDDNSNGEEEGELGKANLVDEEKGVAEDDAGDEDEVDASLITPPTHVEIMQMTFDSLEEGEEWYNWYAKIVGFSKRNRELTRSKKNQLPITRVMVCSNEGQRRRKEPLESNQKERALTRCLCPARIVLKINHGSGRWYVHAFQNEHNHELVPPHLVPWLRSHRDIPAVVKDQVIHMYKCGMKLSAIRRWLEQVGGGHGNMGFLATDLKNFFTSHRRKTPVHTDAEGLLGYMQAKSDNDPLMFWKYSVDCENRLSCIFWCDSKCRLDYAAFHDTMAFDTTYKVNNYGMPLVIFVGVNNHRQTVVFGSALVRDETTETYCWVLDALLEAMDNIKPGTVITDGDLAMANAIQLKLPGSVHRLCLWHLERNAMTNAGKQFAFAFVRFSDKHRRRESFEAAWPSFVRHLNLENNNWVADLYYKRGKWAEAYLQGRFFAGMRTTQRCESMNSFLKLFVRNKMHLYEFIHFYDIALSDIRTRELGADYQSSFTKPVIRSHLHNIAEHAASVYTRAAYRVFEVELRFESLYVVRREEERDGSIAFWLSKYPSSEARWVVLLANEAQTMSCCCGKLESVGFPCRHMIAVIKFKNIDRIPPGLILRRWTIHANDPGHLAVRSSLSLDIHQRARYAALHSMSNRVFVAASKDPPMFNSVRDVMHSLAMKFDNGCSVNNVQRDISRPPVSNPPKAPSRRKGKGCATCGTAGHHARNCPGPSIASPSTPPVHCSGTPSMSGLFGDDVYRPSMDFSNNVNSDSQISLHTHSSLFMPHTDPDEFSYLFAKGNIDTILNDPLNADWAPDELD